MNEPRELRSLNRGRPSGPGLIDSAELIDAERRTHEGSPTQVLRNMVMALRLHPTSNTSREKARLVAVEAILRERRRR